MLWIGVDRESEQDQLRHRNPYDHRERQAIALELDELLADDAQPARKRKVRVHWRRVCMRWMKTSSRPGSMRCQWRPGSAFSGAIDCSSFASSEPVMCSTLPNAATCSTPGNSRKRLASAESS